ncbi:MarR family transcriptional regulator [Microbacterium imperiale]|uniref:Helix-turn-helix domain-containing protein n=1 Tax=Microbacterium imperiale TaxID=33884 RepID=A0A9W6HGP7_9MICO|nr:helix-turn-helix domain-containing protein [Microbacterium imperiale]MBP2422072.1 hypothetical protein [Microbacterium imperiale]MDS0200231.1 hypothetical protein [Microbacterium imperiale]BFE39383.1 hypothetical protein GCM10017544_03390 [Microbacterium imperiale]GLJ79750.1 hypothetical protein GCM10017586_14320 [Microbacterium imperiale]
MRFPKQFVTNGALARAKLAGGDLRVIVVLIALAGEDSIVSGVTQTDIADQAGLSRKSTRVALERLSSQRLVTFESGRGKAANYRVLPEYFTPNPPPKLAPTRAIRVPTYAQVNGTPEGANSGDNLAPLKVPTPRRDQQEQLRQEDELFEQAWKSWPKKDAKKVAREVFSRAAKRRSAKDLAHDIERFGQAYALSVTEIHFVPGLAPWLRQERWNDDLPIPRLHAPKPRSRDDENMALVARLAAQDQQHARDCEEGNHDLLPDNTCKHCDVRPWQLELPVGSNF